MSRTVVYIHKGMLMRNLHEAKDFQMTALSPELFAFISQIS